MSRIVPHGDMSADEIIQCSYDAMAIIELCRAAADNESEADGKERRVIGAIGTVLRLAGELLGPVHDALESHEGALRCDHPQQ